MEPLHHLLRDGTRRAHARLSGRFPITDPDLAIEPYRAILGALRGWFAPLEERLRRASAGRVPLTPTERTAWLDADLRHLGLTDEALSDLPACDAVPELAGPWEVYCCRYVIEGASLGGVLIARQLRARFGEDFGGVRFFSGHGAETGTCWREFLDRLELARRAEPLVAERVLDGAGATFASLEVWLEQRGTLR